MDKKGKIYAVGLGPGAGEQLTFAAREVLERCPVIVGYPVSRKTVFVYAHAAGSGAVQNGF